MAKGELTIYAILGLILLASFSFGMLGFGSARAESQYTGHVVDVVEDKGIVTRPSWVNMKTDPRSSDIQQYCIHTKDEERLLPGLYGAMENGERMTVTYSRPVWVSPLDCKPGQAIVHSVRPANTSA